MHKYRILNTPKSSKLNQLHKIHSLLILLYLCLCSTITPPSSPLSALTAHCSIDHSCSSHPSLPGKGGPSILKQKADYNGPIRMSCSRSPLHHRNSVAGYLENNSSRSKVSP